MTGWKIWIERERERAKEQEKEKSICIIVEWRALIKISKVIS